MKLASFASGLSLGLGKKNSNSKGVQDIASGSTTPHTGSLTGGELPASDDEYAPDFTTLPSTTRTTTTTGSTTGTVNTTSIPNGANTALKGYSVSSTNNSININNASMTNNSSIDQESKEKDELAKLKEQTKVRDEIIHNSYILNWRFKHVAYCCIVFLSVICMLLTTIYCVYMETIEVNISSTGDDYSEYLCLNSSKLGTQFTNEALLYLTDTNGVENALANLTDDWYVHALENDNNNNGNSFGSNLSTTERFLLELLISHLLSIFIYSPLITLLYPTLYNYCMYRRDPSKTTEGKFFSENDGFDDISNILSKDKVDESGKTIRLKSVSEKDIAMAMDSQMSNINTFDYKFNTGDANRSGDGDDTDCIDNADTANTANIPHDGVNTPDSPDSPDSPPDTSVAKKEIGSMSNSSAKTCTPAQDVKNNDGNTNGDPHDVDDDDNNNNESNGNDVEMMNLANDVRGAFDDTNNDEHAV